MYKPPKIITILFLIIASTHQTNGQKIDIIDALYEGGKEINTKLPLIDSLPPFYNSNMSLYQKKFQLTKKELREIKSITGSGEKIRGAEFNGSPVINGDFYYEALAKADTDDLNKVWLAKPFYVISLPLYFDNNQQAFLDVDLIGSYGTTYLFIKKEGKWIISKSFLRYVV